MSAQTHKTKKDVVVETLRDMILTGDLQPGERLLQEELAEQFAVSATPVREAIQQLVAEGVLSHLPYKGVQVVQIMPDEIVEVCLIRASVEDLATRVAVPQLRIMDVKRLHDLHETIKHGTRAGDVKVVRKANFEFHMLIYNTARMPLLYGIIRNLWSKFPWDRLHLNAERAQKTVEEHQRILEAINQGDAEAAGSLMKAHVDNGIQRLEADLKADGSMGSSTG